MKRILSFVAACLMLASCSTLSNLGVDTGRLIQSGVYAIQGFTLSDAEVQEYVHQYITQLDAQSKVLPESSAYTKRLRKLTKTLEGVNEVPLNFKVYQENEVNAFACADGSVRVYTGIMDVMDDDELMGVIGHELGHVALSHTRKQMQNAIFTSAAREGLASTNEKVAVLTDSQLGALGESILNAKYSRKQETEADDYGYNYLCEAGVNPWSLVKSFEKLQQLEGGSSQSGPVSNLFSSHPNTQTRIDHLTQRCLQDGYERPAK